jgi:hypothetical protein
VETKRRDQKDAAVIAESDVIARVQSEIKTLTDAINAKVGPVPLK